MFRTVFKITLITMAFSCSVSANAQIELPLEQDALFRLKTQLIKLQPKIQSAQLAANPSQLRFNYVAFNSDRKRWVELINSYLKLTNFDNALDNAITVDGYDLLGQNYTKYLSRPSNQNNFIEHGSSFVERDQLANIRTLISRMKPLMTEAESTADSNSEVFFKYDRMHSDRYRWIARIDDYLSQQTLANEMSYEDPVITSRVMR